MRSAHATSKVGPNKNTQGGASQATKAGNLGAPPAPRTLSPGHADASARSPLYLCSPRRPSFFRLNFLSLLCRPATLNRGRISASVMCARTLCAAVLIRRMRRGARFVVHPRRLSKERNILSGASWRPFEEVLATPCREERRYSDCRLDFSVQGICVSRLFLEIPKRNTLVKKNGANAFLSKFVCVFII